MAETKVAFVGAGSMVFARNLVGDVLSYPELEDSEIALMDIDEHRLDRTATVAEAMVAENDVGATVTATTDRREALTGADYVIVTINVGGTEPFESEIRIPERYGVEQAIGDTLGPGGVFRGLRTMPDVLEIARDMEEVCPGALMLNYTNPMGILTWAIGEATDVDVVGLCHSVPHTAGAIADYVGVPADELEYWVAGINHMAWFLECTHDGESVYPALRAAMEDPETYERDTVRFEMFRHFDAFVTESSHHMSEYVPYFRTDEETIEAMSGEGFAGRMETAAYLEGWKERSAERDAGDVDIEEYDLSIERSEEYGARVIHAIEADDRERLNLNLPRNDGLIANLGDDACVEVPCLVDGTGVHPCQVGELPPQLAALDRSAVAVQRLAVEAGRTGDRDRLRRAIKLDPLTAATCTLDEIDEMVDEILTANSDYLPMFDAPAATATDD